MNKFAENLNKINQFMKYIQNNVQEHSKIAISSNNLEEIENSILLLEDYEDVINEFVEAIDNYTKKTGYEG